MNRFVFAGTLLLFTCSTLLHGENIPPNGQGQPAAPRTAAGVRALHDLPYVTGGHERQRLDLYLPAVAGGAARPVVAWIHGGAWQAGDKNDCPAQVLVARGYVVASIGYRLSQHAIYPAQIEDCKAAIRWLRAHASEYGIDPERIGVWGASAGGHLAALLGTTGDIRDFDVGENLSQSSKVECVIDWFGPTDFAHYGEAGKIAKQDPNGPYTRLIGGLPTENPELVKRSSPVTFVQPGAAPFLIMQGDKDTVVPAQQSEVLQATLQKAGVESTLKILPGAGHGGPAFSSPESVQTMTDFLDKHLHPHGVAGN